MTLQKVEKIWMDGELVDWDNANVHVLTHALHYGTGALEGIRAYETERGTAVFRLTDHIKRLIASSKIMYMDLPYSVEELVDVTKELMVVNKLSAGYIRPLAFRAYGEMGLNPTPNKVSVVIACWPWGAYLPENGIRVHISSWQRIGDNALPPAAKTTANYMNSALAKVAAIEAGYDEAIMLNAQGQVAEASAANVFVVHGETIVTPPTSAGALKGIRRDSVMTVARGLGYEVTEAPVVRADLYTADEVFVTGTASEVAPVKSVDDRAIGDTGPLTLKIQQVMNDVVRGKVDQYKDWVEYVE